MAKQRLRKRKEPASRSIASQKQNANFEEQGVNLVTEVHSAKLTRFNEQIATQVTQKDCVWQEEPMKHEHIYFYIKLCLNCTVGTTDFSGDFEIRLLYTK